MTKVYTLKSGKTFTAPSMFVNPQTPLDVKALWKADEQNGLQNIDGIYIRLMDHKAIYSKFGFNTADLFETKKISIRDKIKLIDPSLDFLLTGMNDHKEKMLDTNLFDDRIKRKQKEITMSHGTPEEKLSAVIREIYPYLQVRPLVDFQLKHDPDMIIAPCVHISSNIKFREQVAKAREMLANTRILLETSLKKYLETKDLMNVIPISKSVIQDRNFHTLFDLILSNKPDHVGIKPIGIRESDTVGVNKFFEFVRQFTEYAKHQTGNKPPAIHLINVDELGYAGYCSGICNIVSPTTAPSFAFPSKKHRTMLSEEQDTSPTYYHPINMDHPKLNSLTRLPCACVECRRYVLASNISHKIKPLFRRVHWLHTKDEEIREFRQTPVQLNFALRDKFARSMRTQLVAYLPENPVFTV